MPTRAFVFTNTHDTCRYIGTSLSIACLIVVLSLHFISTMEDAFIPLQRRALIRMSATYLVALVLFIVAIEYGKTGRDDTTCAVIGGLLHYFLLASFCWMAVEGQILYQMFVVVFTLTSKTFDEERLRKYSAFAYGAPATIVLIMVSGFSNEYGNHGSGICWLTPGVDGAIWSFVGPALIVAVVNFGILLSILRHLSMASGVTGSKSSEKRFKVFVSATFSAIMGVTWLLAIFMLTADGTTLTIVSYAFTLLNAFTGVWIFVFHGGMDASAWRRARKRVTYHFDSGKRQRKSTHRGPRQGGGGGGGAYVSEEINGQAPWSSHVMDSVDFRSSASPSNCRPPRGSNTSDYADVSTGATSDRSSRDRSGFAPWMRRSSFSPPPGEPRRDSYKMVRDIEPDPCILSQVKSPKKLLLSPIKFMRSPKRVVDKRLTDMRPADQMLKREDSMQWDTYDMLCTTASRDGGSSSIASRERTNSADTSSSYVRERAPIRLLSPGELSTRDCPSEFPAESAISYVTPSTAEMHGLEWDNSPRAHMSMLRSVHTEDAEESVLSWDATDDNDAIVVGGGGGDVISDGGAHLVFPNDAGQFAAYEMLQSHARESDV
jgi:hypothetical protein